ncbi:MAG: site-specific DNA-methyltransferase [Clostridia bacterium]
MNNKVPQEINNIVGDNLKALAQLFPSAVKDGLLDVEALKEELGQFEEVDTEKYELSWSGKQNSKKLAQQDVYNRTLKYIPSDSKNADTTENLYIEGDNLEVLKLLRQNYYGSIKMIYIDPPYNTGNDFVYNDKFAMDKKESDIAEGVTDDDGNPLQKNLNSQNRYHANWLNMMYPRLKIAKDLLTDDGVIFISIDDNEIENLRKSCKEIFGESNFIAEFIWKKKQGGGNDSNNVVVEHEYIVCFSKNSLNLTLNLDKNYKLSDSLYPFKDTKGDYGLITLDKSSIQFSASLVFEIIGPEGTKYTPRVVKGKQSCWRWSKTKVQNDYKDLVFKNDKVYTKYYRPEGVTPRSLLIDAIYGRTESGNDDIKSLFPNNPFSYPKPILLVKHFISLALDNNDIILDFFSGSATTAHAVMQLNAEDGGNRKFIMVQYPELTDEKSEASKAGYKNICEIGKERIRRAGDKIKAEIETANAQLKIGEEPKQVPDIGFKVFRADDTNIKWNIIENMGQFTTDDMTHTPDLMDFVLGYKDIDVVYEIMLRQKDVALSDTLETLSNIGKRTYLYASSYLICLETEITEELIEKLAALAPLPIKFVFRDSAFKDDIDLKDYSFRRLKSLIDRNNGDKKQTYTVEFI